MVWAAAKVTPPVSTVTIVLSPSATVSADAARPNCGRSLSVMSISRVPIGVPSWLAVSAMLSVSSTTVSSRAVSVALPEVALAAMPMSAGVIV